MSTAWVERFNDAYVEIALPAVHPCRNMRHNMPLRVRVRNCSGMENVNTVWLLLTSKLAHELVESQLTETGTLARCSRLCDPSFESILIEWMSNISFFASNTPGYQH